MLCYSITKSVGVPLIILVTSAAAKVSSFIFFFSSFRTCATLLQTQPVQDLLELGMCAELGQLDVHATTQAGSQVGGAGQDVAQMLVPHEAVVVLLEDLLNLTGEEESAINNA